MVINWLMVSVRHSREAGRGLMVILMQAVESAMWLTATLQEDAISLSLARALACWIDAASRNCLDAVMLGHALVSKVMTLLAMVLARDVQSVVKAFSLIMRVVAWTALVTWMGTPLRFVTVSRILVILVRS